MSAKSQIVHPNKLKSYCAITSSKRIYAADYVDEGVPFVRGKEVVQRFNNSETLESKLFISRNKFESIRDRFGAPVEGDLLLTSVGTLGVPYLVKAGDEFYFKDGNLIWFREFDGLDSKFFYYWLRAPRGLAQLSKCTIGTSQSAYTIERLNELDLDEFSSDEQGRIASILSAYDDLIENNRRRIQLLEKAARLLYREWFVRLRFPGHEHVKIIDGVPEGWEKVFVPEIIEINPRTQIDKNNESWYIPMTSLSETGMTINKSECERRKKHTNVKFRNRDVLFARITPCLENGKTGFVQFLEEREIACGSTEFIILRGKQVSPEFTYCLSRTQDFRENAIKSMIGSSGRQRVQVSCFDKSYIGLPPEPLLSKFQNFSHDCFEQVKKLEDQTEKLKQARDLLLPRLMNGEIEA